ncbi:MAG TPA: L-histidine N(alpha)-methyltransferase [Puia sp.]|nr:L-histidine N(alpha)-methyltransferase [Puia sp.]
MTTLNFNGQHIDVSTVPGKKETSFCSDIIQGLKSSPKYLWSKYFYDSKGDRIFQEIMQCDEYYPFKCELEIFKESTQQLADRITFRGGGFDLIELGTGDGTKTSHLLKHLVAAGADFTYMPIDISSNIIHYLKGELMSAIPGIRIAALHGEYFDMLEKAAMLSNRRKVVLFLGSNLGNMPREEALTFCRNLRGYMHPGDIAIIGLDLKKDPATVLSAYNDKGGITREFNLNLLTRINRELQANFDVGQFHHFPIYDPGTGSCKSYLISKKKQEVTLHTAGGPRVIHFSENEEIFMEISQKYSPEQVISLARQAGFAPAEMLFDKKKWFVDAIWEVI